MKKILTSNGKPLFKDGKLLASSRGSGSATVKKESGWFGTTVPNTGHVDKVYFNTELSVEEVMNIITNIEYHTIEGSSIGIYGLLYSFPISLIIFKYSNEDYTILSAEYGVIWSSIIKENDGRPKAGWYLEKDELTINLDVNNVVGDEVIGTGFEALLGFPVGEQNAQLSTLFSTTPFTYEENSDEVILTGEYDGRTVTVDTAGGWKGTTVPNNGYVENVYFNTDLSIDEVVDMLKKLPYKDSSLTDVNDNKLFMHLLFFGKEETQHIVVLKAGNDYNIAYRLDTVLFSSALPGSEVAIRTGFSGWNPEITYPLSINCESVNSVESEDTGVTYIGTMNDEISSLFSITPFTYEEPNFIDMKKYINNKQLPLNIKLNGPKIVVKNTNKSSGTPIPKTGGYIENIYLNIDATPEDVIKTINDVAVSLMGADLETIGEIELVFLMNEEETIVGIIGYFENTYVLMFELDGIPQYSFIYSNDNSINAQIETELGFIGWNPELQNTNGVLTLNVNAMDLSVMYEDVTEMVQSFVNGLAPFISVTPFSSGSTQQPTVVPNKGYVENVYFNTSLNTEEVVTILDTLEDDIYSYDVGFENDLMHVIFASEATGFLTIVKDKSKRVYGIASWATPSVYYFNSDPNLVDEVGFIGWKPDFNGTIVVNGNVEAIKPSRGSISGSENYRLTKLFSLTPFEPIDNTVLLKGEYDGSTIIINELPKGKNIGTTVPNNEYVNKIYINPNITIDDLRDNLKKLEWVKNYSDNDWAYNIFKSDNISVGILISGTETEHEDLNTLNSIAIVAVKNNELMVAGTFPRDWQPNAETPMTNVLDIKAFPVTEYETGYENEKYTVQVGHQNNLLSSLFSITPYSDDEKNTINVKKLLEQQKLPLNIKVNIPNAIEMVNELPTSNVQKDVIYKVDKITTSEVYLSMPSLGSVSKLNDTWQVTDVDVLPDNMLVTGENGGYVYVCGDYAYIKIINEDTGEEQVLTIGEMYTAMGVKLPDKGVVKNIEEMTEDGIYIIKGGQITLQGVKGETYNYIDDQWYNFKEIFEGINDGSINNIDNINFGMKVRNYLFVNCSNLKEINSEKIKHIGVRAFSDCDNLTTVNLPKCTEIDAGAFYSCQSLSNITIPNCKRIWGGAFQYCQELKTISLPLITEFGDVDAYGSDNTFEGSGLIEIYLPSCHTLRYRTFALCQSLVSVKLPVCINLGEETFDHCYALTDLYLGKRTTVYDSTFKDLVEPVKIHVRTSMIGDYQNDSDWKSLVDAGKVILVGDYTD